MPTHVCMRMYAHACIDRVATVKIRFSRYRSTTLGAHSLCRKEPPAAIKTNIVLLMKYYRPWIDFLLRG